MNLIRKIEWTPEKNYGIHGVELKFLLIGPKGVIQFVIFTNWMLPRKGMKVVKAFLCGPMPADIGYHSPIPQYENQKSITQKCPYLDGKPCYYDGSSLAAQELFDIFVEKGEEVIWKELEERYNDLKEKE